LIGAGALRREKLLLAWFTPAPPNVPWLSRAAEVEEYGQDARRGAVEGQDDAGDGDDSQPYDGDDTLASSEAPAEDDGGFVVGTPRAPVWAQREAPAENDGGCGRCRSLTYPTIRWPPLG
jgi:hypothetical protein